MSDDAKYVYLVDFCTGEYDGYVEHPVYAFTTKEKAKAYADKANAAFIDRRYNRFG